MPFVFYRYGERIRMSCKYAAQAHEAMEQLRLSRWKTNDLAALGDGDGDGQEEK